MAIKNIRDRLAFLNRGQGWVARQLREILPRIRDDAMYADCNLMLKSHEQNVARTNELLG